MKKTGILNSGISQVISEMGHKDILVICDSGFPIPPHVRRIDLALKKGVPSFMDTLETVLVELQVEKACLAEELHTASPDLKRQIDAKMHDIDIQYVSHVKFKMLTKDAKAIIRTGEFTPYANIILEAGVVF